MGVFERDKTVGCHFCESMTSLKEAFVTEIDGKEYYVCNVCKEIIKRINK
jgi:uncharacterized protein YlzI (FlbEa/FlbD family)